MAVCFLIDYPQAVLKQLPAAIVRCQRYNVKAMTPTRPEASSPWWRVLSALAVLLAVAGVASLAFLVAVRLTGGQTWTGLNWIAMIALPVAFVLLIIAMLRAAWRRRRL